MRWAWLAAALAFVSQGQGQGPRGNWPCGGRIDPSYFQIAEATGGSILLVAPWEIADAAVLTTEPDRHPQTIFRLAGTINPGPHEFRVPIDPSVESVVFSIAVQCLQTAEVIRPSGEPAAGADVTDFSNFAANRMTIVTRPAAGTWTIRAAGSGLAGVMVKARSTLGISNVEFAPAGGNSFGPSPAPGVENVVKIGVEGRPAQVEAAVVDAASKDIAPLALAPAGGDGVFVSRFTPGPGPFRVVIRGRDAGGAPFQRVYPPLLTAR